MLGLGKWSAQTHPFDPFGGPTAVQSIWVDLKMSLLHAKANKNQSWTLDNQHRKECVPWALHATLQRRSYCLGTWT